MKRRTRAWLEIESIPITPDVDDIDRYEIASHYPNALDVLIAACEVEPVRTIARPTSEIELEKLRLMDRYEREYLRRNPCD